MFETLLVIKCGEQTILQAKARGFFASNGRLETLFLSFHCVFDRMEIFISMAGDVVL